MSIVHYRYLGTVARVEQDSDFMKTLVFIIPVNTFPWWFLFSSLILGTLNL